MQRLIGRVPQSPYAQEPRRRDDRNPTDVVLRVRDALTAYTVRELDLVRVQEVRDLRAPAVPEADRRAGVRRLTVRTTDRGCLRAGRDRRVVEHDCVPDDPWRDDGSGHQHGDARAHHDGACAGAREDGRRDHRARQEQQGVLPRQRRDADDDPEQRPPAERRMRARMVRDEQREQDERDVERLGHQRAVGRDQERAERDQHRCDDADRATSDRPAQDTDEEHGRASRDDAGHARRVPRRTEEPLDAGEEHRVARWPERARHELRLRRVSALVRELVPDVEIPASVQDVVRLAEVPAGVVPQLRVRADDAHVHDAHGDADHHDAAEREREARRPETRASSRGGRSLRDRRPPHAGGATRQSRGASSTRHHPSPVLASSSAVMCQSSSSGPIWLV